MANGRVSPAAVPQQDPESGKAEEVEEPNNVAAYVCCFLVYLIAFPIALCMSFKVSPDSKVHHGANMGPIWGRQDPDGPHVGPMSFAIWEVLIVKRARGLR